MKRRIMYLLKQIGHARVFDDMVHRTPFVSMEDAREFVHEYSSRLVRTNLDEVSEISGFASGMTDPWIRHVSEAVHDLAEYAAGRVRPSRHALRRVSRCISIAEREIDLTVESDYVNELAEKYYDVVPEDCI